MPVLQLDNRREALVKEEAPCHLDLSKLIQTGTRTFYNNPALSDLTLVCPDGRVLHCHSVILAAASRRFAAALKQGNWTPGQQMPVKGVDSYALETLICAFYTAECPLELGRVPALYDAAIKLEVPSLAPALEQYLNSALQPHNCCQMLELCLSLGVSQLADLALEWIRGRVADVVPSSEFRCSRLETAAHICKDLAQRSQLVALQAAVSWLSATAGRSSLAGVFAEATGLSVDAIQAVAVSGAGLGPMGHGGGQGGGSLLQLSHAGHGLGHGGSLLGSVGGQGPGPSLKLQGQGMALGHEPALTSGLDLAGSGGGGGLGLSLPGNGSGGGGGAGIPVLQLLPTASGSQAVLVMPPGSAGGVSGESSHHHSHGHNTHHLGVSGLQSLLSLHGNVTKGGVGLAGMGRGGSALGLNENGGGPAGLGLDALADAAEGERVQKRMRAGAVGGGLMTGPSQGAFVATATESGSATSMHSDMSGGGRRMAVADDSTLLFQRMQRDAENSMQQKPSQHPAVNHHGQQQQHVQQRSKPQGGRCMGGRRKRGVSASDDDEDYAPTGGRTGGGISGGGTGGRSRDKELVYDAEMLMDGSVPVAGEVGGPGGDDAAPGANGSVSSDYGDDDADGQPAGGEAAEGTSAKANGAASGCAGGGSGNAQGTTPVLMTGRRAPAQKGMCHVQGCHRSLQGLRDYYQRYKICEHHLKVSSVLKDGVPHRFCQQCGRFHQLSEFDGDRRSCRTMLQRHCHRRAKQKQELAEVLAQRLEEKQVAASMSAVVAAMARNAQATGNVANLSPMLQLQYLAGLPAAAAAAAGLDEDPLSALGAAAAMTAVRSNGSSAGSDGSGASAKTGMASVPVGSGRSRGVLPPGLHSPPSKAQLLEAVQRARKQHAQAQQQLLGIAADVPLAAALAAAAAAAGGDFEGGQLDGGAGGSAADTDLLAAGGDCRQSQGRNGNGRYASVTFQDVGLGGGGGGDIDGGRGVNACGGSGGAFATPRTRISDGGVGAGALAGDDAN